MPKTPKDVPATPEPQDLEVARPRGRTVSAEPEPIGPVLAELAAKIRDHQPLPPLAPLVEPQVPSGSQRRHHPTTRWLQRAGKNAMISETNLARSPIWFARPAASDEVLLPNLYGQPIRQVEGPRLRLVDQWVLATISTSWVRAGCHLDRRRVPYSLTEAAREAGYSTIGGRQLLLMKEPLRRLASAVFEQTVRHPNGVDEEVTGWHFLDRYHWWQRKGHVQGWALISEDLARLLAEDSVTRLHRPTWSRLRDSDELAARLWVFLEAESLEESSPRSYSLFATPAGEVGERARQLPAIGELLGVHGWTVRKLAASRVRRAVEKLEEADPRYALQLEPARGQGMWNLVARRRRQVP